MNTTALNDWGITRRKSARLIAENEAFSAGKRTNAKAAHSLHSVATAGETTVIDVIFFKTGKAEREGDGARPGMKSTLCSRGLGRHRAIINQTISH